MCLGKWYIAQVNVICNVEQELENSTDKDKFKFVSIIQNCINGEVLEALRNIVQLEKVTNYTIFF